MLLISLTDLFSQLNFEAFLSFLAGSHPIPLRPSTPLPPPPPSFFVTRIMQYCAAVTLSSSPLLE